MKKKFLSFAVILTIAAVCVSCDYSTECACTYDVGTMVVDSARWEAAGYPFYIGTNIENVTIYEGTCSGLNQASGPDDSHFYSEGVQLYYFTECVEN